HKPLHGEVRGSLELARPPARLGEDRGEPSLEGAVAEFRELLDGALEVRNRCGRVPLFKVGVAEAARRDRPLEGVGRLTERPLARRDARVVLTDRGVDDSAHPGREGLELGVADALADGVGATLDRKSTRLNSSHVSISYAVFCLKKKK